MGVYVHFTVLQMFEIEETYLLFRYNVYLVLTVIVIEQSLSLFKKGS